MKKLTGLTSEEVELSRKTHGANILKREKKKSLIRRFLENLGDPIIKILLIAVGLEVLLSFGHCNYFEVGGIIIAVLIATGVSTFFEYGSEAAFLRLEADNMNSFAAPASSGSSKKPRRPWNEFQRHRGYQLSPHKIRGRGSVGDLRP